MTACGAALVLAMEYGIEVVAMEYMIKPARRGIAGQVAYDVTCDDGSSCTFVGSEYGSPGPIVIILNDPDMQCRIDYPGRFGDKFDREWVERFFSDER